MIDPIHRRDGGRRRARLVLAVALAAATAILPATGSGAAREAADGGLGMALMSAAVAFDGTLLGGAGAVSSFRIQTGVYEVAFNRDVRGCAHVATIGIGEATIPPENGLLATAPRNGNGSALFVTTTDEDGRFANRDFHLIVFCAR